MLSKSCWPVLGSPGSCGSMELRVAFIGMGNVGRAFARLLERKRAELSERYGITWAVAGIATGRHGSLISEDGLDLLAVVDRIESGLNIAGVANSKPVPSALEMISQCRADILFETTALNPIDGQPAVSYIRQALLSYASVVTANKAPVAYAYRQLSRLAADPGVMFRLEGTVMDGCPVFNLAEFCLPGAKIVSFSGVLNSTTNLILTGMEDGRSIEECLAEAQRLGIAEADPDHDLEGWDSAIKAIALTNVLMGIDGSGCVLQRSGIEGLTAEQVRAAMAKGDAIRLVSRATLSPAGPTINVGLEQLPRSSALGCVRGTSNALVFETDV